MFSTIYCPELSVKRKKGSVFSLHGFIMRTVLLINISLHTELFNDHVGVLRASALPEVQSEDPLSFSPVQHLIVQQISWTNKPKTAWDVLMYDSGGLTI